MHPNFNVADLSLFLHKDDSNDKSRIIRGQVEKNDSKFQALTPTAIDEKLCGPFDGLITQAWA